MAAGEISTISHNRKILIVISDEASRYVNLNYG